MKTKVSKTFRRKRDASKTKKLRRFVSPSLFSSIVKSYHEIMNKGTTSTHPILPEKKIFIVDYPNVMYILYEKYHDIEKVSRIFYRFLLRESKKSTALILLCKNVIIDNAPLDIASVLNMGRHLTSRVLSLKRIFVYILNYAVKVSSSIDDLLGYFICAVLFLSDKHQEKKIVMLTNDGQRYNKNLMGIHKEEEYYGLRVETLCFDKEYTYCKSPDSDLIHRFLFDNMTTYATDIEFIECNIQLLVDMIKLGGDVSYKKMNESIQTFLGLPDFKTIHNTCRVRKKLIDKHGHLKKNYYLYAVIKYVQSKLFHDEIFGSYKKAEIIEWVE